MSTETEEGKTYFEIEESVAAADLPAPVKTAVASAHPKGKIAKAEKVTRGAAVSYDVVLRVGKTNVEMSVDPTGKVLKDSKTSM